MKLQYIDLKDLKVSPINVRKHGGEDVSDLRASIASLGVIQPLLVRQDGKGFEVVAGQRRLRACTELANETGKADPVPCAILDAADDAAALEASLAENVARLPMDALDQFEAFAALHKEGRSIEDIAAQFGVTDQLVRQRLAIAGLDPAIRKAFRNDKIEPSTLRALTMATKRQQKAWLKLFRDPHAYAPQGWQLKSWLFGGKEIPVSAALFDLAAYKGAIISDLFSEERYFADHDKFWTCQNAAIAKAQQAYLDEGWQEVSVLDTGQRFDRWDHCERPKEDGGRVYIAVTKSGEVSFHEGWMTEKEAKRLERAKAARTGEAPQAPAKPELAKAAQRYIDLHRHNAVRCELLKAPSVALRLKVAHVIAGSPLWEVRAEDQNTQRHEGIVESLEASKAQKAFATEREAVKTLLGFGPKHGFLFAPSCERPDLCALFARLLALSEKDVMRVLTFIMAESLASGSKEVEALGHMLGVDMGKWWEPDQAFFDLLRDKEAINAMLAETGGAQVAQGNVAATAKVQKAIIHKHLKGEGGREKAKGWLPRYMRFPMSTYTKRGGLAAADYGKEIGRLFKTTS